MAIVCKMRLSPDFISLMGKLLPQNELTTFLDALYMPPTVSFRLNAMKRKDLGPPANLMVSQAVEWASGAYYCTERPSFVADPLFHAGMYYVQEASSMFLEQAVRQLVPEPVRMLDLCASPGGKTTHLCDLLPSGSLLVANETIRSRVGVLAQNLVKWGYADAVVTNNDPVDFATLPGFFDLVLADLPCSGEGMFRKTPASAQEWGLENVGLCAKRQRRLVADVWPSLCEGGLLIYSTCTYNTQENEENILWIRQNLGAEVIALDIPSSWGVTGDLFTPGGELPVYRFLPHRTRGEGFFMAVLRKLPAKTAPYLPSRKRKETFMPPDKRILQTLRAWLDSEVLTGYRFMMEGNVVSLFPSIHLENLTALKNSLRIVQAGVEVCYPQAKTPVPTHALAMSARLRSSNAFPTVELTLSQALAYLGKDTLRLPSNTPQGYVLLVYHNCPLGFVKNIGTRVNNLYPTSWRILNRK